MPAGLRALLLMIAGLSGAANTVATSAAETEILGLSGTGYQETVDWEFFCTEGRRSGEWTTIPVPSPWELEGFGRYNYGHDKDKSREQGRYRHRFRIPESWRGKIVDLVFDGVMTDAEVRINGESAGPRHQGGFYRFRYEVTELLRFDAENLLEVTVSKHSSDESVNRAERDADYWVFGGIYRPVTLEALPSEAIDHLAVDARHDGSFRLRATLRGLSAPARLEAQIRTAEGAAEGAPFTVEVAAGQLAAVLETRIEAPRSWSAENPHLYQAEARLVRSDQLLHHRSQRFGFRTVEVRGDGLHVNGHRVLLRGVNRHAFWPPSGRTLNRDLDFRDARLIKAMNMNAVRSSHYPPDPTFLDACDELGIYVLDELAGWHDAYATAIGRRLVREMVERDVNHPSILFWTNGNEGGWNLALDEVFGEHDLQRRPVLHPDEVAAGIDTRHYPTYAELERSLDPASAQNRWRGLFGELPLVMPTELLHGLYDGGSGAGLEDYWGRLRGSPRAAGGFLWSFSDESVVRTDRDGDLDSAGNYAPDGILGPYREMTGSYYAVRELFSPIVVVDRVLGEDFDGALEVENRYDMTDLASCRFAWSLVDLPGPGDPDPVVRELGGGELPGPRLGPGKRGRLVLPLPADGPAADGLRITAYDPYGGEVWSWFLPIGPRRRWARTVTAGGDGSVEVVEEGDRVLRLAAGATEVGFDRRTGELTHWRRDEQRLSFGPGLGSASGKVAVLIATRHYRDGTGVRFDVRYREGLEFAHWKLFPSGWLRLSYQYSAAGSRDYLGIGFPYPEENVLRLEWLGDGPARVWKNRLGGGVLGVWTKRAADSTPASSANEPKLRGYYGDVYWARLHTTEGDLTLVFESDDLYLGLFSPEFPEDARHAVAAVPPSGITFLNGISPIGTKFHAAEALGPQGQPDGGSGLERGTIWLFVGELARPGE